MAQQHSRPVRRSWLNEKVSTVLADEEINVER